MGVTTEGDGLGGTVPAKSPRRAEQPELQVVWSGDTYKRDGVNPGDLGRLEPGEIDPGQARRGDTTSAAPVNRGRTLE